MVADPGRRPLPAARAQVVLADLRLRQGRGAEAAALLDAAQSGPARKLVEIPATVARAQLALDEWEPTVATELAGRVVERSPRGHHWERLRALAVLVSAHVSVAQPDRAADALVGMGVLCEAVDTEAARACRLAAEAVLAACDGDVEGHRRRLHEAVGLYQAAGEAPQAAAARLQLARALMALDRPEAAAREAGAALGVLAELGAAEAERARALVESLEGKDDDDPGAVASAPSGVLTPRELEVLALMAAGHSNRGIATELFLSVRTVERHVSSIYRSLGVSGKHARAEAVAAAQAAGLLTPPPPGLAPAPPAELRP
jgi:DNA-binding NarL/FixJ family response regulator